VVCGNRLLVVGEGAIFFDTAVKRRAHFGGVIELVAGVGFFVGAGRENEAHNESQSDPG
jgi:hypothetical protein